MRDAGRIGFAIKGNYNSADTYDFLDVVYYNHSSYVAKKKTSGNPPADDNEYWQILARGGESAGGLVPMGTITFSNLPASKNEIGDMYNISNDFTSDSRFEDGGGLMYRAGANVYYTAGGKWDVLTGVQVTGVKGDAESAYRSGNVNLTKANIGLGNVPNVTTDNQTPVFTQASERANIASGEKLSVLFGKVMKWFSDLKTVAFTGKYGDLTGQPNSLKNPNALTFTGGATGSYDGSAAKSVAIPTVPASLPANGGRAKYVGLDSVIQNQVTTRTYRGTPGSNGAMFMQEDYEKGVVAVGIDGMGEVGVNQAYQVKNPLTFTGGVTGSYNGSMGKSVAIPSGTNNLLATATGTWLDAVQGKALKDSIDSLNGRLGSYVTKSFMNRFTLENGRTAYALRDFGINDLNDINFNSIVNTSSSETLNQPTSGWYYVLTLRFQQTSDYRKQFSFGLMDNHIYTRVYSPSDGWTSWEKLH